MRLLDAADVQVSEGNWMVGYEAKARECDVNVYLADACAAEFSNIITGEDASVYFVAPFAINAELLSSTFCYSPDAPTWLKGALKDVNERALGRAFIMQPTADSDTWLGGMREAPLPPDPPNATGEEWLTYIANAREMWTSSVIGENPIMHVAPEQVPGLITCGVLKLTDKGELISAWGDVVVASTGYSNPYPIGDARVVPWLWFTGPIKIYITPVDTSGLIANALQNHTMVQANQIAAIDFAPCAAVRLGPVDPDLSAPLQITVTKPSLLTVQVTAPNAIGQVTYNWGNINEGADTVSPSGATVTSHTYSMPGTLTITATDSTGRVATSEVVIAVELLVTNLNDLKVEISAPGITTPVFYTFAGTSSAATWCHPEGNTKHIRQYMGPGSTNTGTVAPGGAGPACPGSATGGPLDSATFPQMGLLNTTSQGGPLMAVGGAAGSQGSVTYKWGDGTPDLTAPNGSQGPASFHTYAAPGTYLIRATDSRGWWGEKSLTLASEFEEPAAASEEFPVEDYPVRAEVVPDETPGPYPLDEEKPKPKPKPQQPAKKAQPKKNTGE